MQAHTQRDSYEEEREEKKIDLHAMSKDMSFPFEAVCEAAAAELTGNTLLCTAWPRAVAAAVADGRCKDFWEIEFQNSCFRIQQIHTCRKTSLHIPIPTD